MLKRITSPLGLALSILFGIIVAVGAVTYFEPNQRSAEAEAKNKSEKEAVDILAGERVAYYTKVLAIFTGALTGFGVVQLIFLDRADKTARISANAAKAAAETLPIVERAYVYPEVINPGALSDCIRDAKAFYLIPEDIDGDKPSGVGAELSFRIRNYGKTPATIISIFANLGVFPTTTLFGMVNQDAILGSGDSTRDLIVQLERGFSRNEALHISAYTKHIEFRGEITFEDIWENQYLTKFIFSWEPASERMQLVELRTKSLGREERE